MKLPLIDIIPRLQRMISRPEALRPALGVAALNGAVEGLALAALLPAISSLASNGPVWGLPLVGWLIVFAVLALLSFAVNHFQGAMTYAVALDFLRSIHRLVGDQVARQPLGWFSKPLAGRLSRMVSAELMNAGEIFGHMIGPLIARSVAALTITIAAWFWNPLLGVVLTVSAPVFALIMLAASHCMRRGGVIREPREVNLAGRIVEFAKCQGALRSSGRSASFEPLLDAMQETRKAQRRAQWVETFGLLLSGGVTQGVIVALITVTGSLAVAGTLAPVPALAFIGLALRFTSTLSAITETAMALESRRPLLDAIDTVLTAHPLPEPEHAAELPTPGTVELHNVSFAYGAEGPPVLRNMTLSVAAGSMVALVGPSGSGKTTIARLISRFYDADSGRVLVGGTDVTAQTIEQLMSQLSMVFQDVVLFDDTLEANIALGREDATVEQIREAADIAGVTEVIDRLPDGWNARVGEGGRALSGGERQRVAIARAILKGAAIVLLDEATSALDVENEINIVAAVNRLRQHSTVIVIAHRLDTIAAADHIIALDEHGMVEAQGTHEELLGAGGTYARFWNRLHQAQGWSLQPSPTRN